MTNQIGIHYAPFSKEIQAGRLTKDGTRFTGEKQTVTDECVWSIGQLVEKNYDGAAQFNFQDDDLKIEVTVTRTKDTTND